MTIINPALTAPAWARYRGEKVRVFWATKSDEHVTCEFMTGPHVGKWTSAVRKELEPWVEEYEPEDLEEGR